MDPAGAESFDDDIENYLFDILETFRYIYIIKIPNNEIIRCKL